MGIGGGLVVTRVLTLALGVPIHKAIATSLCELISTSTDAAAQYVDQRLADIRLGMTLVLGTTIGAVVRSIVAAQLGGDAPSILPGCFLASAASRWEPIGCAVLPVPG